MGKKTDMVAVAPKPAPTYSDPGTPAPKKPDIKSTTSLLEFFRGWAPFYESFNVRGPTGMLIPVSIASLGKLHDVGGTIVLETSAGVITVEGMQLHAPREQPRLAEDAPKAAMLKQLKALQAKVADGKARLDTLEGENQKLDAALKKQATAAGVVDAQFGTYRKELDELAQLKKENKSLVEKNAKLDRQIKKLVSLDEAKVEDPKPAGEETAPAQPPKAPV